MRPHRRLGSCASSWPPGQLELQGVTWRSRPKSLNGKVVAITGGARGIGKATAQALVRQGARVGIGDLDVELARKTAEELGVERARLRARRDQPAVVRGLPRLGRERPRAARRAGQQRRDHADHAVPRRERRLGRPPARHQRARHDLRHEGGAAAHAARAAAATWSTSRRSRARAASRTWPPTARPSTRSSA